MIVERETSTTAWAAKVIGLRQQLRAAEEENRDLRDLVASLLATQKVLARRWSKPEPLPPTHPVAEEWEEQIDPPY